MPLASCPPEFHAAAAVAIVAASQATVSSGQEAADGGVAADARGGGAGQSCGPLVLWRLLCVVNYYDLCVGGWCIALESRLACRVNRVRLLSWWIFWGSISWAPFP